ncbi:dye-decolorizing heme-containing peroxidase [Marasmius crinis-equi]|uniref:Dye-decolorizing heme-containing peroxidase n=1 Tax=Marasmius crinis-equi TaxID=585013 RepID=A0ABR3FJR4_9AGAR
MRLSAYLSIAIALAFSNSAVNAAALNSREPAPEEGCTTNLNNQLPLPDLRANKVGARHVKLDTDNIQGLTMVGMRFMKEVFFFFNVSVVHNFKIHLANDFYPLVTTATQLADPVKQPNVAVNIAFSRVGLNLLEVEDDLGDPHFNVGQAEDAVLLGDPGTSRWHPEYQKGVHGVIQVAGKAQDMIDEQVQKIKDIFGDAMQEVYRLNAFARPGDGMGHEHFGWVDGITQPGVEGWDTDKTVTPGQAIVKPGVILLGEEGDNITRPTWAKDGSFLCWRQLQQLVPEYHQYLDQNAPDVSGLSRDESVHLFGSRMMGRWKSGAPIDLSPLKENATLGADTVRRNNFTFDHPEFGSAFDIKTNQTWCPFSAHILRSRPRAHSASGNSSEDLVNTHMMRGGLPYGPEVTKDEAAQIKSSDDPKLERGMAFAAYQSTLEHGFIFSQNKLVDNTNYPEGTNTGVDAVIGSLNQGPPGDAARTITGMNWNNHSEPINIYKDFVVTRGGEYFFSPPVSAIKGRIAEMVMNGFTVNPATTSMSLMGPMSSSAGVSTTAADSSVRSASASSGNMSSAGSATATTTSSSSATSSSSTGSSGGGMGGMEGMDM